MLKIATLGVCILALSGSVALAQDSVWRPPGPDNAPYGANGAASVLGVGGPTGTVNDTATGRTESTSMLSQTIKGQSLARASQPESGVSTPARYSSPEPAYGALPTIDRSAYRTMTDCLNAAARVHAPLDSCGR